MNKYSIRLLRYILTGVMDNYFSRAKPAQVFDSAETNDFSNHPYKELGIDLRSRRMF